MSKYYSSEIGSITITMINVNILVGKTFKDAFHNRYQFFEQTVIVLLSNSPLSTFSYLCAQYLWLPKTYSSIPEQ